jgi:GDPmannose 4,6-dehydratase
VNPEFFRPAEVEMLLGNPSNAEKVLGWRRMVSFEELVRRMVENDIGGSL